MRVQKRADEEIEESVEREGLGVGILKLEREGGRGIANLLKDYQFWERVSGGRVWRLAAISWNDAESNCVT